MSFLIRLLVSAAAIWVATLVVPGLDIVPEGRAGTTVLVTLAVALVFGVVNALVRPLVTLLTLPLYILTLGLFVLVVNALMLALTAWITELTDYGLRIDGFWEAVLGGLVVSIVSFLLNVLVLSRMERRQEPRTRRAASPAGA